MTYSRSKRRRQKSTSIRRQIKQTQSVNNLASDARSSKLHIQHASEIKISDEKLILIFNKVGLKDAICFHDGKINKNAALAFIRPWMGLTFYNHWNHIGMSDENGRGQFTIGDMTAIKHWYRQNKSGGRKSKKIYKMRRT